jgi:hypothetical protein
MKSRGITRSLQEIAHDEHTYKTNQEYSSSWETSFTEKGDSQESQVPLEDKDVDNIGVSKGPK